MKKMRNMWGIGILILMLMGMVACKPSQEELKEELSGVWEMALPATEEEARYLLELIDLMEEEMVLVETAPPEYKQLVEFRQDGTYRFAYDSEGTRASVAQFYRQVFEDLYEEREELDLIYKQHFGPLTKEQMYQFYADLYEVENFEILIQAMTNNAYRYDKMQQDWETGTYTLENGMIYCVVDGQGYEASIDYDLQGDVLILTYYDGMETYYRR